MSGLPWIESLLLAAVLSPTDPVFAAAIVGRDEIPHKLRNLLNVESGLNDGLALPIVVVLIAVVGSGLPIRQRATAAWFDPKGFASVVYGLLIVESGIDSSDELFHLTALVIVASIIAHSSSDVAIARWLDERGLQARPRRRPATQRCVRIVSSPERSMHQRRHRS